MGPIGSGNDAAVKNVQRGIGGLDSGFKSDDESAPCRLLTVSGLSCESANTGDKKTKTRLLIRIGLPYDAHLNVTYGLELREVDARRN